MIEMYMTFWKRAYDELRAYFAPYLDADRAGSLASTVCGLWARSAGDRVDTPHGPYALLYGHAISQLRGKLGMGLTVSAEELEDAIPVATSQLPYGLTRLYAELGKMVMLSRWDRDLVNTASRELGKCVPGVGTTVVSQDVTVFTSATAHLVRCAFDLLQTHQCIDCLSCMWAIDRWDADDRRTEKWLVAKRLGRVRFDEQDREDHDPS